jgi:hypothetical protein
MINMRKIGDRVGAINKAENGVVEFFGYGKYVGDEIPKEAKGFLAKILRKASQTNPKLELDNGKVVYGCECWWGDEVKIKEILDNAEQVIEVDIDKIRGRFAE